MPLLAINAMNARNTIRVMLPLSISLFPGLLLKVRQKKGPYPS
jgi:hypothetical protein